MPPSDAAQLVEEPDTDLPPLTHKQMKFVEALLKGLTGADAYREAYDCSGSADPTIWARASELRADSRVAVWLSAARQAHLGSAILTRENHMRELERLRELAIDQKDVKTALGAEVQRGHVAGLRVDRSEITINNPAAILSEIGRINPDIAQRIAETYAIPFAPIIDMTPNRQPADLDDEQNDDYADTPSE